MQPDHAHAPGEAEPLASGDMARLAADVLAASPYPALVLDFLFWPALLVRYLIYRRA